MAGIPLQEPLQQVPAVSGERGPKGELQGQWGAGHTGLQHLSLTLSWDVWEVHI